MYHWKNDNTFYNIQSLLSPKLKKKRYDIRKNVVYRYIDFITLIVLLAVECDFAQLIKLSLNVTSVAFDITLVFLIGY